MTAEFVLAIDVGNSRTKIGLCRVSPDHALPECLHSLAEAHADVFDWQPVLEWLAKSGAKCTTAVMGGSNPARRERLEAQWPGGLPQPRVIDHWTQCGLDVRVNRPDRVGMDRLLNAIGANALRAAGQPVLIVDSGTATTVDLVDGSGSFLGGAILPGLGLSALALHEYTAILPLVPSENLESETVPAPGIDTEQAIACGLFWGQVGAVRGIAARYRTSLSASGDPLWILTGGAAVQLAPEFPGSRVLPNLCLQALASLARG